MATPTRARVLSPAQKLATASALWHAARSLKAAWLRTLHPDWSAETVHAEVRRIFLYAAG